MHAFRILKHGVMDGLVDGLFRGRLKIRVQSLQNLVRTKMSGFVQETFVEHTGKVAHSWTKRKGVGERDFLPAIPRQFCWHRLWLS